MKKRGLLWRPGLLRENAHFFQAFQRLLDPLLLGLAGFLAYRLYLGSWDVPKDYLSPILLMAALAALLFPAFSMYQSWRGSPLLEEIQTLGIALSFVTILLVLTAAGTKTTELYSRGWFGIWIITGWIGLICSRCVLRFLLSSLRKHGFNSRNIIIVGHNQHSVEVTQQILDSPWTGLNVLGYFEDSPANGSSPELPFQYEPDKTSLNPVIPKLGSFSEVHPYLGAKTVDQIWITLPLKEERRMNWLLNELRHCTADIRYVPDLYGYNLLNHSISHVAGVPVLNLSVSPISGINQWMKEAEDKLLAFILLLLISPILLVIAMGVKLSSKGPVIYKQERVSWNGRSFMMFKFRSLPVDTEQNGATWGNVAAKNPTKFGAFIRRYSLDELPQFLNVLMGDMSIVGPRPERPQFVNEFKQTIPDYMRKHVVKAGITGWAQINGLRGDTDLNKRLEYDLHYIENWSLWFDLKIILMTPFKGMLFSDAK